MIKLTQRPVEVAILGGTGYSGSELVRLLLDHPQVSIRYITSEASEGQLIKKVLPQLRYHPKLDKNLNFVSIKDVEGIDLLFSCLPQGKLPSLAKNLLEKNKMIINLAGDYRLKDIEMLKTYYPQTLKFKLDATTNYVFPDFFEKQLKCQILNLPGCMASAAFFSIYPLFKNDLIENHVVIDVKSASSGAGKNSKENHAERSSNFRPHKLHGHRHAPEVQYAIRKFTNHNIELQFSTHSMDLPRGIFVTAYSQLKDGKSSLDVKKAFVKEYNKTSFIKYVNSYGPKYSFPMIKTVIGTNYAEVGSSVSNYSCVSTVAIDNIIKGSAGQAVQLMNKLYGFDETIGLISRSLWP